ncbi:MAG: MFS transporter [Acidimicrobiales bacterium]|nr:MFS transporter [Acidimicrobiales bacterium]
MRATTPAAAGSPWSRRVVGFLAAEAFSAIGSWATIVAIWGYAAYEYDATAGEVALFGIAFSLPGVLLGPVTGTVIDRLGPKVTLGIAKVVGFVAALALLAADDFRTLAFLAVFHGVAMAFSYPALQAMPPRLVEDEKLARANALVSLTDELAIVLGPVAAGVGISAFGFRGAFVFDALTYLLGLAVLPMVRLKKLDGARDDDPPVRFRDAMEGWKLIARSGILRRVVSCTFAVHILYGTALLAEPLYVRDVLHRSESVFAALQTAFGICLVIGGLLAARLGERLASFGWIALGVFGSGITSILYLGTPWVAVAFLGVGLWGVSTAVISGPSRTVIQRSTPQRAHGRVLSADFVAGSTAELLGVAVAGVFVSVFGVQWTILGLGLGVSTAAILLHLSDRRDASTPNELAGTGNIDDDDDDTDADGAAGSTRRHPRQRSAPGGRRPPLARSPAPRAGLELPPVA